jgi:hypothetical protein
MNGPHGSIAVKGALKEGQLSGEFDAVNSKARGRLIENSLAKSSLTRRGQPRFSIKSLSSPNEAAPANASNEPVSAML